MAQIPALILTLCHIWLQVLLCKYADLSYRMIAKLGGGHEERQELVSSQVDKYITCVSCVSSVSCVRQKKDVLGRGYSPTVIAEASETSGINFS